MNYSGMTVNERLYEASLLDAFDQAAKERNRKWMIEILTSVELNITQAEETTDAILKTPSKYGY